MANDFGSQVADILKELSEISESQARMEEKLDTVIKRSHEDRARISINSDNITALRIEQATISDRQRGLTALSSVLATVISTLAAVTVGFFSAKQGQP